jgi:hypothetical protein
MFELFHSMPKQGKEGVSQRPAGPVERIAVAVLETLEADVDVNGGGAARLREGERHHRLPHREGSSGQGQRVVNDDIWFNESECSGSVLTRKLSSLLVRLVCSNP